MSKKELGEIIATEMKNYSLQGNDFSIEERLKACFKPRYDTRMLKNKGAILVLIWGFILMSVYYFIDYQSLEHESNCRVCFYIIQISISLVLPFAGWLADVHFGRYRIICWSVWAMWISTVLVTANFVVVYLVKSYNHLFVYILVPVLAVAGAGFGGFQANIIQFGVDQLTDASTTELISFINWYACAYLSSGAVTHFNPKCTLSRLVPETLKDSNSYMIIASLLLCASVSVLVISILFCSKVLIKEPVTRNPFKLIIMVVKYAIKNKTPRQRSAFTYCEDYIPSRLDFGKRKYGGPFTTEQVEDVKTFFRMLGMILIIGSVFGITEEEILKVHLDNAFNHLQMSGCLSSFIFTNIYYITGVLLIPLNEIVIYPLFHRCLPTVQCYWKVMLGVILHFGRYIALITLITVARQNYLSGSANKNATILNQCLFNNSSVFLHKEIDYRWFAIPQVLSAISFLLIIIGTIEFYCAQVPYSMKGVVSGIFYGTFLVFRMLSNGLPQIFGITWKSGLKFSCEFWYLQTKVIFLMIVGSVLLVLLKYYKKRKREDVLPSEHIFAERYYDSSN